MQFQARVTGGAAALAQTHRALLERLPATFQASILVELEKWANLFPAEQTYQKALLQRLAEYSADERTQLFAGLVGIEKQAGCDRISAPEPGRFQDEAQAVLRKQRLLPQWRQEVDRIFQHVQPALDRQLYPPDAPRRLVVQVYGTGISMQTGKLWSRFGAIGVRVPLTLEETRGADAFLRTVFGGLGDASAPGPSLFGGVTAAGGASPLDAWIVESGEALHAWAERAGSPLTPALSPQAGRGSGEAAAPLTGLSYERLRGYRDELTRALYSKIQTGVESPQAFAAYARSLRIAPAPGVLINSADILQAFVRDVFLTGNGTLFVNNTFVEWAAVQALRRAQPRVLAARYGVRDKMKPFSSLLLFSQPRATDQIPLIEDPVGSFVDVEQLSYYVWLSAEKTAAYRDRTLYVFLAEGVDEALLLRSDARDAPRRTAPAATLADVSATMAAWLGVPSPAPAGRVIEAMSL